jgi:hypothetical protein
MQEPQTWRDLLAEVINNPREKYRLATELGVRPITLVRWVEGTSEPRLHNLRHLLDALPQHRDQLTALLKEERGLEDFSNIMKEDTLLEIPSKFYIEVLTTLATITPNRRFRSICELILAQALHQLDPEEQGMAIWIITCMPPSGPENQVRSLSEQVGRGTNPWNSNLEQRGMFLGSESLAGYSVLLCRECIINDVDKERTLPASQDPNEKSCAIYPILCANRIAGVLSVSSTQYDYFKPQSRLNLVQDFANLIALAFDETDFYELSRIHLRCLPPQEVQRTYFKRFQDLARGAIQDPARSHALSPLQAEQAAWRQLESIIIEEIEHNSQLKRLEL